MQISYEMVYNAYVRQLAVALEEKEMYVNRLYLGNFKAALNTLN